MTRYRMIFTAILAFFLAFLVSNTSFSQEIKLTPEYYTIKDLNSNQGQ
jgi:hypothetical protein